MSTRQRQRLTDQARQGVTRPPLSLTALQSYRYVRVSMVGLLVALAAAVVYQSVQQHVLLSSISAYYYTPAQAIFVGALIGLGVAMIALRGTTDTEDVVLNLGGMLAPVIAVVPTSRGQDFVAAVEACRAAGVSVLTGRVPTRLDCPTVRSLTAATKANVQNNMVALFVAGGLALLATLLFAWLDRDGGTDARRPSKEPGSKWRWGAGLASALYVSTLVTFWLATDWFIDHAHYFAAGGLFVCIVVVVVANGFRRNEADPQTATRGRVTHLLSGTAGRWYLALAVTIVVAAAVLICLVATGVITPFWLEAVLIALFAVFWVAQTWEQWNLERKVGTSAVGAGDTRILRAGPSR